MRSHRRRSASGGRNAAAGETVSIAPLAFEVDDIPGVELFQIVQTAPTSLRVRLRLGTSDTDRVWHAVERAIKRILDEHELGNVRVDRDDQEPARSTGGKYRSVIPLRKHRRRLSHRSDPDEPSCRTLVRPQEERQTCI